AADLHAPDIDRDGLAALPGSGFVHLGLLASLGVPDRPGGVNLAPPPDFSRARRNAPPTRDRSKAGARDGPASAAHHCALRATCCAAPGKPLNQALAAMTAYAADLDHRRLRRESGGARRRLEARGHIPRRGLADRAALLTDQEQHRLGGRVI